MNPDPAPPVDAEPVDPAVGSFDPTTLGTSGPTTWVRRLDDSVIALGLTRVSATAIALGVVAVLAIAMWWVRQAPPTAAEAVLPLAAPVSNPPSAAAATPSADPADGPVVVHVAGAVGRPGVHTLAPGERVADAIAAAGGAGRRADLDRLNLAEVLTDGTRVYVARVGEPDVAAIGAAGGAGTAGSTTDSAPVNVNQAGPEELDALPGVGPATAQAIISEREANGPFSSVDDLLRVRGIGDAKLAAMRELVVV